MLRRIPPPGPDQYRRIFGIKGAAPTLREMGRVVRKKSLLFLLWIVGRRQPIKAYGAMRLMQADGLFLATPNRIYPLFALMEKQGLVKSRRIPRDRRGAREYSITPRGRELLKMCRVMLNRGLIGEYMRDMVK